MGREIRRVPADWEHPRAERGGRYRPLCDGRNYHRDCAEWIRDFTAWEAGTHPYLTGEGLPGEKPRTTKAGCRYWWDYDSGPPLAEEYMLVDVPESLCTHYQLYETTTEGTPHHDSPVFESMDELLDWAAEHATTFAHARASRERWAEMLSPGNFVHHVESMPNGTKVVFL